MLHRVPLEPIDPEIERRRIHNWFHHERMDTVDIARALNITETEADHKLTRVLEIGRLVARGALSKLNLPPEVRK